VSACRGILGIEVGELEDAIDAATFAGDTIADATAASDSLADSDFRGDGAPDSPAGDTADSSVASSEPISCNAIAAGCGSPPVSCCSQAAVAGGSYHQGRAPGDADTCPAAYTCGADELPYETVTVSTYRMDVFEVTVARFRAFYQAYPASQPAAGAGARSDSTGGWSSAWSANLPASQSALLSNITSCNSGTNAAFTFATSGSDNLPMNCVSWFEAFAFCAWDHGRLPTESEWEFEAAGGSQERLFPWGSSGPNAQRVDFAAADAINPLETVGYANAGGSLDGAFDLAGCVSEWTLDCHGAYATGIFADPANLPASCASRVVRGGDYTVWLTSPAPEVLRGAARAQMDPTTRSFKTGFRCVRAASP
jgi:formylglycine-generating enzyme required for sulfatase activity